MKSAGESCHSAASMASSIAASAATTTRAPRAATALRSSRQAWWTLSGVLKWKSMSVTRAPALVALRVPVRGCDVSRWRHAPALGLAIR